MIPSEVLKYRKSSKKTCKRCPNCRINIEKNEGCNHMTCSQCHFQFCWFCKREWNVCCNDNIVTCLGRGILKHRIWGQQSSVRYATKTIGLPIVTGLIIGVGATGLGVGAGAATVGLVGLPFYYTGKYIRRRIQQRNNQNYNRRNIQHGILEIQTERDIRYEYDLY